jgi:hypothetical protein
MIMATTTEQIQQLVQELGPSMPEIDAVVQTEEPSWAIQFSDETIVIIEAAEQPERLVVSAELGVAQENTELQVYEAMLSYNLMWQESGGIKIGLAGPKGALIISAELCLVGLTLMDLQLSLNHFLKITRAWSQYLAQADQAELPALPGLGSNNLHLHA